MGRIGWVRRKDGGDRRERVGVRGGCGERPGSVGDGVGSRGW